MTNIYICCILHENAMLLSASHSWMRSGSAILKTHLYKKKQGKVLFSYGKLSCNGSKPIDPKYLYSIYVKVVNSALTTQTFAYECFVSALHPFRNQSVTGR